MSVPAPTVDLAQCRACNGMTESTLDRVNALTSLLEASNDLGYIVGIDVPQSELTVLIVFTNGIDVALQADKEAEVVATRDSSDANRFTEWHHDGVANLLTLHSEWPGEGFSSLRSGEV